MKVGDLVRVKGHSWTLGLVKKKGLSGRLLIEWINNRQNNLGRLWPINLLELVNESR